MSKAAKVSKDYQKLIRDLDSLKDYCGEMAKEQPHGSWREDITSLQEAMDIISDYEKVVADYNRVIQHYEMASKARRAASGVYFCPNCGKKIQNNHSYCHWCGKRIG